MKSLCSLAFLVMPSLALATNTGGVFGPVVKEGHRSMEYRVTVDPDDNGETSWAQRLHYQQALNGDFQLRLLGQTRSTAESETDFDFVQAELTWQTIESKDYNSGFRFDLRYRDNDRPNQFGVNWLHQYAFSEGWQARVLLLTSVHLGSNRSSGVALGTRANISKATSVGRLGLEMFSSYGRTNDLKGLKDQSHSLGLALSNKIGSDGYKYYIGALAGVTDAADDLNLRFRLSKSF